MVNPEGKPRKRLLLVEDEALIALAEKKALEKYRYDVLTVDTGEAAVEAVAGGIDADLVLMDIDLGPGMDGTQAADRILELRDLPILFLSSHTEPEIVERTEKITSYGYVVKNSSITVLDASIKMAFKLFDADRKTLESERKQNALIANISDVIVIIGRDGTNKYKSPNIHKWFGWEPGEVVGRPALDNVHPDDRAASREILDRLMSSDEGTTATTETRYRCKDGSYKWI
ncbi:MAG TPA: response regulator, partial [Spirochaetia bacterium]|nr:response regulator [Spirochaetia bacterium]